MYECTSLYISLAGASTPDPVNHRESAWSKNLCKALATLEVALRASLISSFHCRLQFLFSHFLTFALTQSLRKSQEPTAYGRRPHPSSLNERRVKMNEEQAEIEHSHNIASISSSPKLLQVDSCMGSFRKKLQ